MKQPSGGVFRQFHSASKRANTVLVLLLSIGTATPAWAQGPIGGSVRAGAATISGEGTATTRIDQISERAVIDWRSFGIGAGDRVVFVQPSAQAATLNRVTGEQVSVILGRLDATGQVLLINPNGVVFGGGAQVNVGSLIATTSNVSTSNFMAGRLVFDAPGRAGAGVANAGTLTAREGGLIALVAPHVRNDGVIVARLGTVALGAADTFTVDLYGDTLINLALSDAHVGQLRQADGEPVTSLITHTGRIEVDGGRAVLLTARTAKAVLDDLINTSGTIQAHTAVEQEGKILLLGEGGRVTVNGALQATGATGGTIEVKGDRIALGARAALDASGATGGGTVHVGGAWQGGDTYRASATTVAQGATLRANATQTGNGGEVVVWSDGHTEFAGRVEATGGALAGAGGRMEVSGKQTLNFAGQADASAAHGTNGSLLLDPAYLTIGEAEASTITRVLRTGTSTTLQADVDITVNAAIYGGDRTAGGGLSLTAGQNIAVNDFIVTNNGAINLTAAQGTVTIAPGKAVFAGDAPISLTANGDLRTGPLVTGGSLAVQSIAGSVAIDSFIDGRTGPVSIRAGQDVEINQPIVNLVSGPGALTVTAGDDIRVNAPVDGRGGVEGGAVTMTAANHLTVNEAVVTNNGALALTATNGALTVASGTPIVSGTGATTLTARGDISTGPTSAGSLTINSTGGSVAVNGIIDANTGATRINAGADVVINQGVFNGQTGASFGATAGRDLLVNAALDARGGVPGGAVTLTAGRNLTANEWMATNNGAVNLTATSGALTVNANKGVVAGSGAIAMRSAGDLTTGAVSGGSLTATSSNGAVVVNGVIDGSTGKVDLAAGTDVAINRAVLSPRSGQAFTATAGRDVLVNAGIDGRGGATGGAVTLTGARNVAINQSVVTNNGAMGLTATNGTVQMAAGTALVSGTGAITVTAGSDIRTRAISGGSFTANSGGGSVHLDGVIDGNTGRVTVSAGRDVNINETVLNMRTGAAFSATAGQSVNVNARIDGTGGAAGGAVTLTATRDVAVNAAITTQNGAIAVAATNGIASVAPTAGLFAGTGAVSVNALGKVTTGTVAGGALALTSRGGSVTVSGPIASTGGGITIGAAGQVDVTNSITNPGATSALTISAGTNLNVNAHIGRTEAGVASGAVRLTAGQHVTLNESVIAENNGIAVTAQAGSITVKDDEGLYAGNGDIRVTSGQTLSTPTVVTTGAVSLRSTGGAVTVDHAIAGHTGAVTIQAATDVTVNQGIASPQSGANLAVTAGGDITVNAGIDGEAAGMTQPSGTVTLLAANSITLNESVVTKDSAITTTATAGTITTAADKGLFAGSGAIAVTSGQTLDTFITETTGALYLTSTGGDVNVNTAIPDTTGDVTITAGQTVNLNETITNLKSGADLAVTAGTDINVLEQLDGRDGAAAGGTVTMTAGNDINVTKLIATNNGAVSLTATNGSVVLPAGTQTVEDVFFPPFGYAVPQITDPMDAIVTAGNGAVSLTSGDNFVLASPIDTTGALSLTSTSGDLTINAAINDKTGPVTITAGDALVVNNQVKSNNQAITLNAGAGGIEINQINDYDHTEVSPVNSGSGNLTLNSDGNVAIHDVRGVATTGVLTIDAGGQIVTGRVGYTSLSSSDQLVGRPSAIVLDADAGIASFFAGYSPSITATSSGGSINLYVDAPGRLRVTTGTPGTLDCATCNITVTSTNPTYVLGPDVQLNAGGSINLPRYDAGAVDLTARSGDLNLGYAGPIYQNSLVGSAGQDVLLNNATFVYNSLSLTAGRDFVTTVDSPIVAYSSPVTIAAGRNLTLFILHTIGAVSLSTTTGDITLNRDLGPFIVNNTGRPPYNPSNLGVASLTMSAGGNITMQGARAEGNVVISAGGDLTAVKNVYSINGTVNTSGVLGTVTIGTDPVGTQEQIYLGGGVSPVGSPGPKPPYPGAAGVVGSAGPGAPAFGEISVSAADQVLGAVNQPGAAGGAVSFAGAAGAITAPGGLTAFTARPTAPAGGGAPQANGSSDPASLDSANAVRAAGQACVVTSEEQDDGLRGVIPSQQAQAESDQLKASCPPAGDTQASTAPPLGAAVPATTAGPTQQR